MIQEINSHCEWSCFVGLLNGEECDRLINACRSAPPEKPQIHGEEYAPDRRQGKLWKVRADAERQWIHDQLLVWAKQANDKYFQLALDGIVKPPEYVEYPAGEGQFDWHNDYGQERPQSTRKLTVSVQLSDAHDYEGGDLEMFDANRSILPRERGSVSVFPSYLYHRVTPVTSGVRRALVGWIAGAALV